MRAPGIIRTPSRLLLAGILLAGLATGDGRAAKEKAPPAAAPSTIIERVSSELVLIETYVTGSDGRPVAGLTADDFVLEVDGHRKPIASVEFRQAGASVPPGTAAGNISSAPGGAAGPGHPAATGGSEAGSGTETAPEGSVPPEAAAPWPRRFVLFFEDGTSSTVGLTAARKAAIQFLGSSLAPTDQVAIAVFDKRLRILRDFTTDRDALRRTVEASLDDPLRRSDFADEEAAHQASFDQFQNSANANQLCQEELARLGDVVKALNTLVESLGPWRGFKAIMFMGDGIPEAPAASWFEELRRKGGPDASAGEMNCNLFLELKRLSNAASSAGVTFNAFQTLGLAAGRSSETKRAFRRANSLRALAVNTGGTASTSNDIFKALREAEADSRAFYVLGYVPEEAADGKYHSVLVRCRKGGVEVRWRRGFTLLPPDQLRTRAVEAAYLLPELYSDLPLALSVIAGPRDRKGRGVDLVLHVPAARLLFLPGPGTPAAHLTVGLVAIDDALHETLRTSRTLLVSFPEQDSGGVLGIDLVSRVRLPLGAQTVTAVLSDDSAGLFGARRLTLPAENRPEYHVFGLSLYSLAERSLWIELPGGNAAAGEVSEPPRIVGPALKTGFASDEPLVAAFKLAGSSAGALRFEIRQGDQVVRSKGIDVVMPATGDASIKVPLPVQGLASGEYTLSLRESLPDGDVERGSTGFRIE